jgi:Antitoxin Phd_YefM, type II toxin-antitoxin system
MKAHSLHEARAGFSKLFDKAFSGEPQKVTRYGKDFVIIVSESDWLGKAKTAPTLGSLLTRHAGSQGLEAADFDRPFSQKRPLGSDFE